MSTNRLDAIHVAEDELVRLLDDELLPDRRIEVIGHVFCCGECTERLEQLEDASAWFASHLAELDATIEVDDLARARALAAVKRAPAVGAGHRRRDWTAVSFTRAAAVFGLLLFCGLSVPPVRAWVADRIGLPVRGATDEVAAREAISPAAAVESPIVSFRPGDSRFIVELAHPQLAGSITLESAEGGLASAQILGRDDETLLILPGGVRIENEPGSTADYRIEIPTDVVSGIAIVVGGTMVAEIAPPPIGSAHPVDLATTRMSR